MAEMQAAVLLQFLRMARHPVALQIIGRGAQHAAARCQRTHGQRVHIRNSADTDGQIKSVRNRVEQSVVHVQHRRQLRVQCSEARHGVGQPLAAEARRRLYAQRPRQSAPAVA
jgi:hypothetical protein